MYNEIVVDSSAILALICDEPGKEIVEAILDKAIISSVNLSEVLTVTNRNGFNSEQIENLLRNIFPKIIAFDAKQAVISANLDKITRKCNLSFGDRACLALAKIHNSKVITADRIWQEIASDIKLDIKLIR